MKICAAVQKGIGLGKVNCDDRALIGNVVMSQGICEFETGEKEMVLAVADGIGGSPAGYMAAKITLDSLRLWQKATLTIEEIENFVARVNAHIRDDYMGTGFEGMGSTMSAIRTNGNAASFIHLGDSRIYAMYALEGHEVFEQLTEDQNLLKIWLSQEEKKLALAPDYKKATGEELKLRPGWNHITGYMGMPQEDFHKLFMEGQIENLDKFLITSDGIHDFLKKEEIREFMGNDMTMTEAVTGLMKLARERGSMDDQTVIFAEIG